MESNKPQQQREERDLPVRGAGDVLIQTLNQAGFKEYVLLGARREDDADTYDVFARSDASTGAIANMLIFMFKHMNDESVGNLMSILMNQPEVMVKVAAFQVQQMAQQQAKAAASPEPAQPAPAVPAPKNKTWLN